MFYAAQYATLAAENKNGGSRQTKEKRGVNTTVGEGRTHAVKTGSSAIWRGREKDTKSYLRVFVYIPADNLGKGGTLLVPPIGFACSPFLGEWDFEWLVATMHEQADKKASR